MGAWAGQGNLGKTVEAQPSAPSSFPSVEVPTGSLTPSNNANFKPSPESSAVGEVFNAVTSGILNSKAPSKIKALAVAGDAFYKLVQALRTDPTVDPKTLTPEEQDLLQKAKSTMQSADALADYLTRQQDALTSPASGATLPSVLTQNTKSLVTSIGTLTSTFGQKFDVFNDYMYGLLQYMDIATSFMDKSYTLNKDLSDQAKKDKEATTEVGDTKMTASEIEVQKNLAMMKNYQFKTRALDNSVLEATNLLGMTPLQIEASKNSYIVEANEFAKSPIETAILESDSVVGMSPREIEVSHRSNEVEARVYQRTPTTVKDIDENVLFDIAPREARLVNDSTMAIKTTDLNNDHLEQEDIDIVSPFDISSIYGFKDCDSVCKALIDQFKDSAL